MKNLLIIFNVLLIGLSSNSCKKVDEWTHFSIDYDESITIPSVIGVNIPYNIPTPDITTNSEEEFAINNTKKDLIEEAILKILTMKIHQGSNGDFDFLKSIKIYINADNLPEVLIASKTDIPDPAGTEIELDTEPTDLKDYIKKDAFNLRVETITDEILLQDTDVDLHSEFLIDAKILGI